MKFKINDLKFQNFAKLVPLLLISQYLDDNIENE